jgi:hypothetical protein
MTDGTAQATHQAPSDVVLNISGLRVSSGDKEIIHGIAHVSGRDGTASPRADGQGEHRAALRGR